MRARFVAWSHRERQIAAFDALVATRDPGGAGPVLVSYGSSEEADDEDPEQQETVDLWFERPARIREERFDQASGERASYLVRDGSRWWRYDRGTGAVHGDDADEGGWNGDAGGDFGLVLDPAPLLGALTFEALGRGERAGRSVVRARARMRLHAGDPSAVFHLRQLPPFGFEVLELEVDAERGVLLRLEAWRSGARFWALEANEVEFDLEIPPGIFHFTPPEGVELKTLDELYPDSRDLTIHEAAREAPFEIFAPEVLPEGWRLEVEYTDADPAEEFGPEVELWYTSRDAATELVVTEGPAGREPDAEPWKTLAEEGAEVRYRSKADGEPQNELHLTLGGTSITLVSHQLVVQELMKLAQSLRPVPPEAAV